MRRERKRRERGESDGGGGDSVSHACWTYDPRTNMKCKYDSG